jgi:hypothetical protein
LLAKKKSHRNIGNEEKRKRLKEKLQQAKAALEDADEDDEVLSEPEEEND